jgi:pyrimidine-nucleoside phosphorylase
MMGQTADIAPADKKLYALRDATATVSYIPLIVASIMSKKLAEGLDALVLDVKTGNGAFMTEYKDSVELARAMVRTGADFGVETQAIVSDMNQPLGRFVGNAHEVYECVKILRGEGDALSDDVRRLSVELSSRMLVLAGTEKSLEEAVTTVETKLSSGQAFEKFQENCQLQGGEAIFCENPEEILDSELLEYAIRSETNGFVESVDALAIGEAIVAIGGGRQRAEDAVDHAVGYSCEAKIGDEVRTGDTLGTLYSRDETQANSIREKLQNAYRIGEHQVSRLELIRAVI